MKIWTKDEMKDILTRYDDQLCKAVVKIWEYQTADEQRVGETKEHNGVGFNGTDAHILSSFAEFYKRTGFFDTEADCDSKKEDDEVRRSALQNSKWTGIN